MRTRAQRRPHGYPPLALPAAAPSAGLTAAELAALLAATGDAVLVLDHEGRYLRAWPGEPDPLVPPLYDADGRHVGDVLPPAAAGACLDAIARALATGEPQRVEYELSVSGRSEPFAATIASTSEGTVVWVARHGAARRERALREAFEAAFDGMLVCGPDLRCLDANGPLCATLGRTRAEVLALDYPALIAPEDLARQPLRLDELRAARRLVTARALLRADGTTVPTEVGTSLLEDGRILFVVRDVTERKAAEEAARTIAMSDELTGLYNRRGFLALAEREWARAARGGQRVRLFAFDVDDLKPLNDAHGHAAGDEALAAVGDALRKTFRHADVVARLGGDEFAALIVLTGPQPAGSAETPARVHAMDAVIRQRLEYHLAGYNATAAGRGRPALAVSVGSAAADPAADPEGDGDAAPGPPTSALARLLADADAALYADKRRRDVPVAAP